MWTWNLYISLIFFTFCVLYIRYIHCEVFVLVFVLETLSKNIKDALEQY